MDGPLGFLAVAELPVEVVVRGGLVDGFDEGEDALAVEVVGVRDGDIADFGDGGEPVAAGDEVFAEDA